MTLLQFFGLTLLVFITSNASAQELPFSTTKLELGGQNIEFSESLQSFVYARKGQLYFYSIEDTSLLDQTILLSQNIHQDIQGIAVNNVYNLVAAGDEDSIYIADLNTMQVLLSFPTDYEEYYENSFNLLDFSHSGNEFIYFDGN